jgi:hypothetical protein
MYKAQRLDSIGGLDAFLCLQQRAHAGNKKEQIERNLNSRDIANGPLVAQILLASS